jgi:TusA-related sulfurtransferase
MKNIILLILFCSSVFGQNKPNLIISSEGIYETKCEYDKDDKEGGKSFLRFYQNGKVLSVETECDATVTDLKTWFNMEMENKSIGDYKIKGKRIKFFTTSQAGTVNYKGRITKNGVLKLKIKSLINGYRSTEKYQFTKVEELK